MKCKEVSFQTFYFEKMKCKYVSSQNSYLKKKRNLRTMEGSKVSKSLYRNAIIEKMWNFSVKNLLIFKQT